MAAERHRRDPGGLCARGRRGFALVIVVVLVAVVAILATVLTVNLTGDNDARRIAKTADILHRLVAEMDSIAPAFKAHTSKYPGRLSHLVIKITSTVDSTRWTSCGSLSYTAANASAWRGPYHLIPIPQQGYNIAAGFYANDLVRRDTVGATQYVVIVMDGVAIADAIGLGLFVDKVSTGAGPAVRFTPNGTNPVQVRYRFVAVSNSC